MESFAEIRRTMFSGQKNPINEAGKADACIMIIDDDLDVSETLTSLLQGHYCLISCHSFEHALRSLTPDIKLVLLDIKMAFRDGIEVFKLLKEKYDDLPIVFHSAYPGSSGRAEAVRLLQHNGYLTKGEYDLPKLLTTIEQAMN